MKTLLSVVMAAALILSAMWLAGFNMAPIWEPKKNMPDYVGFGSLVVFTVTFLLVWKRRGK